MRGAVTRIEAHFAAVARPADTFAATASAQLAMSNYWLNPVNHNAYIESAIMAGEKPDNLGVRARRALRSRLPSAQDGDALYMERSSTVAAHALCMRERHWPDLNPFDPSTLHRDLLSTAADRPCANATDAAPSGVTMTHSATYTHFDDKLALAKLEWLKSTFDDSRVLCTEPSAPDVPDTVFQVRSRHRNAIVEADDPVRLCALSPRWLCAGAVLALVRCRDAAVQFQFSRIAFLTRIA